MSATHSSHSRVSSFMAPAASVLAALILVGSSFSKPISLQAQSPSPTPRVTVDDYCTAMAVAPDGRLAYATRHLYTMQKFEVERDDIWVLEQDGRRRKIVNGERMARGAEAFSYSVSGLRWSPDGARITAELLTSQITPTGDTQEDQMLLLLGQDGREIKIVVGDAVIPGALDGAWLGKSETVAYLTETAKPKLMFSISTIQSPGGRLSHLFDRRSFAAISWNARLGAAVAIERNLTEGTQPRLVALDLLHEDHRPLATLDSYFGGLSISPSGGKVAYFRDADTLEVRQMTNPDLISRVQVAYGTIAWGPDESRIMVKRGLDRQEGDLVWVPLPAPAADPESGPAEPSTPPQLVPILNGQTFREFALSPDGHSVAVILPGKRFLQVFDIQ